jgi:hypothetical protein
MTAVNLDARRRATTLARGAVLPFFRPLTGAAVATAVGGLVAAVAYVVFGEPAKPVALALLAGGLVAAVSWRPMGNRVFRAAAELVYDHNCHELEQWKSETGIGMPRTRAGQLRWLDEHPTNNGRASLLLALGRVVEANAAMDAISARSLEDEFDVALLRSTAALYRDGTVDTRPIHDLWRALPPGRERRHRQECTAVLDAMLAFANGNDPTPVLARARRELDVHWTMRIPWIAARWIGIGASGIALGLLIGYVVRG